MTLEYDKDLPPKPKLGQIHSIDPRKYVHEVQGSRAAAAAPNAPTTVLTDDQLKQCGYEYINNPIVRRVTNSLVFFTQSGRTRPIVEANDELLETSTDEQAKELEQQINDDTLTVGGEELEDGTTVGGQPARIKELKRKLVRLGKRVKFHPQTKKGITSCVVFGRGFLEIVRLPVNAEWPRYGEPIALKHLVSRKVVQCYFNDKTGEFEGIDYNTGKTLSPIKFIPSTNLIPFFMDDNNILENTQGSGLSLVWPILSVSQSDDVINDEDIPEITKNTGGVLTIVEAGTNDDNKLEELKKKIDGKTQSIVGDGVVKNVHSVPLGRDPHELTDVRTANSKYITQGMNVPLFSIFEETATYATANQAGQVYKAGTIKDYRTSLAGTLEDYWFDTIVADHFNVDVRDVISLPIKVRAVFDDINFETRKEIIEGDHILKGDGVFNEIDIAKDIDRKDIIPRLETEMEKKKQKEEQAKQDALANLEAARQQQQQNQNNQQVNMLQMARQAQQASAAASIKQSKQEQQELEIINARLGAIRSIQSVAEKINADL